MKLVTLRRRRQSPFIALKGLGQTLGTKTHLLK
jgi:hypothetical protein